MKNTKQRFLLQIVVLMLSWCPVNSLAMDRQLQAGATFDWWKDNDNASASQLTFPLLFTETIDNLSVRLITAFTSTSLSTGSKDISMSGMLDTKIGATYRLTDTFPFELLFGLDFNLPTGTTNLSKDETRLVMDPDLLPINSYGEGFNVNPTITIAKGWNNWTFALGLGYLWRGSYDFSADLKDYQPGMVFNTLAEARYYYQAKSYARIFTGYTVYGTDTANGKNLLQEGDVFQIGGSVIHAVNPDVILTAGLRGIMRGDTTDYTRTATDQNQNAYNGDEIIIDLGGSYALDSKTTLTMPLQLRFMADNGNSGDRHVGAKKKYSLGAGISREITPILSADFTLKGYYKHDDPTRIPEAYNARTFTGAGIAASLTGRF
ncbi:MAG TPA: transporter [Desulfuromonadales bacterium]|nr:transporter [Desulfuromonadales bacterium]